MNIRSSIAVLALGLGAGLLAAAPASASSFPPLSSNSTVEIQADFSGKCLEVADARTDDGAPIVEATCTGASNQQWNITNGYVFNVHSGKCLDLPGWNRNAGTAIDQWTCNQGDNQRWGHLDLTGGGMSIVNTRHAVGRTLGRPRGQSSVGPGAAAEPYAPLWRLLPRTHPDQGDPTVKVHPVTALFPMLGPDELLDLAQDIESNGLTEPVILDADGVLLDGRGRLAACELADVEPRFTTYQGDDPVCLIVSANRHHPNTTASQHAMIAAMARSLSPGSLPSDTARCGINVTRLSIATTVLEHAPDLAEQVRIGTLALNAAYTAVRRRKADAKALLAQHARLRQHAPDLAEQVIAGHLAVTDATAALDSRQEEEHLRRRVEEIDAIRLADGDTTPAFARTAEAGDVDWRHAHQMAEQYLAQRHDAIRHVQHSLAGIAELWSAVQDLAHHPRSPYAREILKGLTGPARTLAHRLIALETACATGTA
ncbi:RICIN domain-containing protein [Kitasatospora aureofaciens]|uniref:RICIN domain-containing protein n=1 Tax=Kitasatospora aureofaciens TaxID=1894 RepID=UPI0033FB82A3